MAVKSGTLEPLTLFKVLRSILDKKMTGVLTLRRGAVVKTATIHGGAPLFVTSNLPQEGILAALVEEGLISSTEKVQLTGKDVESNPVPPLVESGLVAVVRLQTIRNKLSHTRLLEAFRWPDGAFEFETCRVRTEQWYTPVSVPEVLIEAVAFQISARDAAEIIKPFSAHPMAPTPLLRQQLDVFERSFPPPNLATALAGGPQGLRALMSHAEDRAAGVRQVAAMFVSGMARFDDGSAPAPERSARPSSRLRPPGAAQRPPSRTATAPSEPIRPATAPVRPAPAQPVHTAPPPPATVQPAVPARRQQRRAKPESAPGSSKPVPDKIQTAINTAREVVVGLDTKTHYEILAVAKDADDKAIRGAFKQLARVYHVDRYSRFDLPPDDLDAVQKYFMAINRAHELLSDASERNEYDISLEMAARGDKTPQPTGQLQEALRAEQLVRNGIQLLRNNRGQGAYDKFVEAVEITPDDLVAHAGLAYAEFLVAQTNGGSAQVTSKARTRLEEITTELSGREEPFYYLGHIHSISGQLDLAVSAFLQALKINPHYAEAKSQLRHVQRLQEQKKTQSGGLFGRWKKK